MIQSDQYNHDDIISVLEECLSLTDRTSDQRILGNDFLFKGSTIHKYINVLIDGLISDLGELYLSVGVSYCRLRCFQEAVRCFQQALGPTSQRPSLLAKVLHNLGAALNSAGRFKPAVGYHRLAAGLYGPSPRVRTDQVSHTSVTIT